MIYLILFLGLILRLISVNQSFWLDEATSATVAKNLSLTQIISNFSPGDFHPPLYYLILKIWTLPFGVSEISTRLLSVLAALATIYVTYLIAKKAISQSVATMAALLLTISPLHIYYSQEARMYSLETLFVTLAFYFYLGITKKQTFLTWLFFSLSLVLVGMTDYLPLLVIPVFWVYSVVQKRELTWFTKLALSLVPLSLVFSAWSPIFARQAVAGFSVEKSSSQWWRVLGKSGFKELALIPIKFMVGRISFQSRFMYGFVVSVCLAVYGFILHETKRNFGKALIFWLWLLVPVTLAFILGFKVSVFSYFRLIFVLPALSILLAIGLSKVKESIFPFVFMFLILLSGVFSWIYLSNPKFHREDWREMTKASQGKTVLFPADSQKEAFRYYGGLPGEFPVDGEVWLVRYVQEISDPKDSTRKKLEQSGYNRVLERNFNGIVVWEYKK